MGITYYGINPNHGATFYNTMSPIVYAFIFYHTLAWKNAKIPLVTITTAVVIFSILNFALVQKSSINSNSNTVDGLFVICLCIIYFYRLLKELPDEQIHRTGIFWVICGLLFISSTKLILFSFAHFLIEVYKDNLLLFAFINLGQNIIFHFVISYGAWIQLQYLKRAPAT